MRDTKLLLRWVCTTIAIFVAVKLLPGIHFEGPWWQLGIVALIFGLFNALVRPILMVLGCPLILLTLGLFIPIINATMLGLTAAAAKTFGIHFQVAGFWPALWGAIVISIVSAVLNLLIGDGISASESVERRNVDRRRAGRERLVHGGAAGQSGRLAKLRTHRSIRFRAKQIRYDPDRS